MDPSVSFHDVAYIRVYVGTYVHVKKFADTHSRTRALSLFRKLLVLNAFKIDMRNTKNLPLGTYRDCVDMRQLRTQIISERETWAGIESEKIDGWGGRYLWFDIVRCPGA